MKIRPLQRDELLEIWTIDRAELVECVYYLEDGRLVPKPETYDMPGWPRGEAEHYAPVLQDCFDRGGTFLGAFDGGSLVGAAVLENCFIGMAGDQLQLKFLHVSRAYRGQRLGRILFEKMVERARRLGAGKLYISATPSENTIDFYHHLGCRLAAEIDADLLALEPDDIHLEYVIAPR